jgi:phosphohistidine phosphatase
MNETVRSVLLIGHNPGLYELAVMLPGTHRDGVPGDAAKRLTAGFPTGALAEFAIAGPWQQLDAGSGRLVRFLTPHDLRDGDLPEASA